MREEHLETVRTFYGTRISVTVNKVRLEDGQEAIREKVICPDGAAAVPVLSDGRIVLVNQWRYCAGVETLEIPAGKVETGEFPVETIRRELREEIKMDAGELMLITSYYVSPGYSTERMHIFLATDLRPMPEDTDADERVDPIILTLDEALARIEDGRIQDGKTILGILALRAAAK